MPSPPFPAPENPILEYLVRAAAKMLEGPDDVEVTLTHLAVHAWFEGGVEGYDLGRRAVMRDAQE